MNSAVGSFAKSTGAATANQSITGLPFAPTAVFLWTAGKTSADAWSADARFAFGFSDGTDDRSVGFASQDAQATSNNSRRYAAKALSITEWGESVLAECDLTLTADGFDLAWTTNNAVAYEIYYLAIDPTSVKVLEWDVTGTGDKAVTGAGFVPELVLHLNASGVTATPTSAASAFFVLGAMTASAQWGMHVANADAQATMLATGALQTDACIVGQNVTTDAVNTKAAYVSMDADGFTVNFSLLSSSRRVASLCLAGGDFAVGADAKPTGAATATQNVTGPGFEPAAVLLGMVATRTSSGAGAHARWSIGATDGTNERAVAVQDTDASADSSTDAYQASAKVIVKANNATPSTEAQADASLTATGFDLAWTTNDAVATLVPWVAFGPVEAGTPASLTVTAAEAPAAGEAVTLDAASNLTVAAATASAAGGAVNLTAASVLTVAAATASAAGGTVSLNVPNALTVTAADAPAAGGTVALSGQAKLSVTPAAAPADGGAVTLDAASTLTVTPANASADGGAVGLVVPNALTVDPASAPAAAGAVALVGQGALTVTPAATAADGGGVTFDAASSLTVTPATAAADGGNVNLSAGDAAVLTVDSATADATASATLSAASVFEVTAATASADGEPVALTGQGVLGVTAAEAPAAGGPVDLTGAATVAGTLTVTAATAPAAGSTVGLTGQGVFTVTGATATADGGTVALLGQAALSVTPADAPAAAETVTLVGQGTMTVSPAAASAQGEGVTFDAAALMTLAAAIADAAGGGIGLTGQGTIAVTAAAANAAADGAFTAAAVLALIAANAAAAADGDLIGIAVPMSGAPIIAGARTRPIIAPTQSRDIIAPQRTGIVVNAQLREVD